MLETVQNQRTITTKKEPCSKKETEHYTAINLSALEKAMHDLSPNAFKMWVYLGKNQNNYTFALSKVDTLKWCGFSKNTYSTAFKELVEEGYSIQSDKQSNHYDFYEVSQKQEEEEQPTITVHKEENSGFVF